MTDPAFQGRGLFVRVGQALYARLEREGFAFVAGFSNANSHRLMTGPLGRTAVRPFPWAIRLLRPLGVVGGLLRPAAEVGPRATVGAHEEGGVRVQERTPGDAATGAACDAIWSRAAPTVRVGCVRDGAFVASRYATRSEAGYRLLVASRADAPVAFLAYRAIVVRGIRAGFLLDFVLPPGEGGAGRALLRAAARLARAEGAALLSALLPGEGPSRAALRSAGFLRIPEGLHPQIIRFSVRGLGRWADSRLLSDPSAWHLSWADTDVV
jgi:hypothetical protein